MCADAEEFIATSPRIEGERGTLTHRIVIRDQGDQFVVHMQIWEETKFHFHNGNYFPYGDSVRARQAANTRREALHKAYTCFDRRARRTLRIGEGEAT